MLTEHGVRIAPSTYYEWRDKLPCDREQRDQVLTVGIQRVWDENFQVYGARKVWLTLNQESIPVARCAVERLMRQMGLQGVHRGTVRRTTVPDGAAVADDPVQRQFDPSAPNLLWVCDFTYVSTWSGWAYTAFVTDAYARRILGWRVATCMSTTLVLDALDQAVWQREREGHTHELTTVIAHSDHGCQCTSVRYGERLAQSGLTPLGRHHRRQL